MQGLLSETLAELLGLVVSVVAAGLFTAVGLLTENAALADITTGQTVLGLWELWMGVLALYAGVYLLGYERVWTRLRPSTAEPN